MSGIRDVWNGLRFLGQAATGKVKAGAPPISGGNLITAWFSGHEVATGLPGGNPYNTHPSIYRGVNVVARQMARIPVEVRPEDGDGKSKIEGHWLPKLLTLPGQGRQGTQLTQAITSSLKLRGEAFLWHKEIGRGEGGSDAAQRPLELWLLNPLSMEPKMSSLSGVEVDRWMWNTGQGSIHIPLEELTFFRYENPEDPVRGLGPVQAALCELAGDQLAINPKS